MTLLLVALLGCSTPTPPPAEIPRAEPPGPVPAADAYPFARMPEGVALSLPPTTRPDGEAPPEVFYPVAPFHRVDQGGGFTVWATPLPVDFHLFLQRSVGARTFGNYAPTGLTVTHDGRDLAFARHAKGANTWGYDLERLLIGLPDGIAPTPETVALRWPKATEEERKLHLSTSGLDPVDFALRTVLVGTESFHGLLLPAPASAAWRVTVPENGVLVTRGRVLPPAIKHPVASNGARLRLEVELADGRREVVHDAALGTDFTDMRVKLGAYAGREVTLRFLADPAGSNALDLVFLEDPVLYRPKSDPVHVVLAFVDTVRADHLGMYGYAQPTTPKLDRWAEGGVRFDDHRTVAPWTLPSTLSALTGHQPEDFGSVPTLAERLGAAGFATKAIVANAYLSQVFGVHRGFGHYDYRILQRAPVTVDAALAELARWPDRDALVLVQFMEAHLPYDEPRAYRSLFAGEKPASLSQVARAELVRYDGTEPDFAAVRDYVVARYDQNLRILDDEVSRLFDGAGAGAITVLFSDHGEEFWEHGGYEHGHTFHDELLRVPLVVRAPGLPPGVVKEPTSLLDLTPTVLELAGLDPDVGGPGVSLVPAAKGDRTVRQLLVMRPQGFGRPLYGEDGWGVLKLGRKWWSRDGREALYDVVADPDERHDLAATADRTGFPAELAGALDREVLRVWRVQLPRAPRGEATLTVSHPAGLVEAWPAYDPKGLFEGATVDVVNGVLTARQEGETRIPSVLYVRPRGDVLDPVGLTVRLTTARGGDEVHVVQAKPEIGPDGRTVVLPPSGAHRIAVDVAWVPERSEGEVSGTNEEVKAALEALGYAE